MTLKSYLWIVRASTLASFAALSLVVLQIDPERAGILGQMLFFTSMLLFFSGISILFFTWIRRAVGKNDEIVLANLGVSFRQGILLAILVVILLIFQRYRLLVWWDGSLLVAGIFLVELYFLSKK
jgi:hypothetical protein